MPHPSRCLGPFRSWWRDQGAPTAQGWRRGRRCTGWPSPSRSPKAPTARTCSAPPGGTRRRRIGGRRCRTCRSTCAREGRRRCATDTLYSSGREPPSQDSFLHFPVTRFCSVVLLWRRYHLSYLSEWRWLGAGRTARTASVSAARTRSSPAPRSPARPEASPSTPTSPCDTCSQPPVSTLLALPEPAPSEHSSGSHLVFGCGCV